VLAVSCLPPLHRATFQAGESNLARPDGRVAASLVNHRKQHDHPVELVAKKSTTCERHWTYSFPLRPGQPPDACNCPIVYAARASCRGALNAGRGQRRCVYDRAANLAAVRHSARAAAGRTRIYGSPTTRQMTLAICFCPQRRSAAIPHPFGLVLRQ
jgi:hypothetical protein